MKIEQTFPATIQGVGEITATSVDLPIAVELLAEDVYPDGPTSIKNMMATFVVPMSVANIRLLGGQLYKRARVTVTIEFGD